jgi:hypothetical protein
MTNDIHGLKYWANTRLQNKFHGSPNDFFLHAYFKRNLYHYTFINEIQAVKQCVPKVTVQ